MVAGGMCGDGPATCSRVALCGITLDALDRGASQGWHLRGTVLLSGILGRVGTGSTLASVPVPLSPSVCSVPPCLPCGVVAGPSFRVARSCGEWRGPGGTLVSPNPPCSTSAPVSYVPRRERLSAGLGLGVGSGTSFAFRLRMRSVPDPKDKVNQSGDISRLVYARSRHIVRRVARTMPMAGNANETLV